MRVSCWIQSPQQATLFANDEKVIRSFITTTGLVSSSNVCNREIISRSKWHQRSLCCEWTILLLAASVCSHFTIGSPFKMRYRTAHLLQELLRCFPHQKPLYCWQIYAVGWVGAFVPCVHLCGRHTSFVAVHLRIKTRCFVKHVLILIPLWKRTVFNCTQCALAVYIKS